MFDSIGGAITDFVEDTVEEGQELASDVQEAAEDFLGDVEDTWDEATAPISEAAADGNILGVITGVALGTLALGAGLAGDAVAAGATMLGAVVGSGVIMAAAGVGFIARVLVGIFTGGADSTAARNAGRFFTEGGRELGNEIKRVVGIVGQIAQRATDITADLAIALARYINCLTGGHMRPGSSGAQGFGAITHFFVLMLENRSFDHMLGHFPNANGLANANYYNRAQDGAHCPAGALAPFMVDKVDPAHEYPDIDRQLNGDAQIPNGGFVRSYELEMVERSEPNVDRTAPMRSFDAATLPVMYALAQEFAVCDNWHSSLPGPTLPNRQFVHAATSGGMADSPDGMALGAAMLEGAFDYEHGTIYDRLTSKCIPWRIYSGDHTPLVMTLKGISTRNAVGNWTHIKPYEEFANDLKNASSGNFPNYVFIEPNYGRFWVDYKGGNSEHPLDSITGGEALVKATYEALRASNLWNNSVLIVTYDEHGGFYDHVPPPAATPPGDERRYESWSISDSAKTFLFDRLGFRVPALVISPWIGRGIIDSTPRDHTTIIRTLTSRFGLRSLTERDRNANSLENLFGSTLTVARMDTPATLPAPVGPYS